MALSALENPQFVAETQEWLVGFRRRRENQPIEACTSKLQQRGWWQADVVIKEQIPVTMPAAKQPAPSGLARMRNMRPVRTFLGHSFLSSAA